MKLPADIPTGPYEMTDEGMKMLVAGIAQQLAMDTTHLRDGGYLGADLRIGKAAREQLLGQNKRRPSSQTLVDTMTLREVLFVEEEWDSGIVPFLCELVAAAGMTAPNPESWRRAASENIGAITTMKRGETRDASELSDAAISGRDHYRRYGRRKRDRQYRYCA